MDYFERNRSAWDKRVPLHLTSRFYDVDGFLLGKEVLRPIELALLGDLQGKSVLHLQCHFGQDTLALARRGARVTGVDFSPVAIENAERLARELGIDAHFVCANVLDTPERIGETFDLVYTTYGVLGWLPDLSAWARVVRSMLKPGASLLLVEFHPVLWMFDDAFQTVSYPYFNGPPIVEKKDTTYTDGRTTTLQPFEEITWNHSLEEVIAPLIGEGLRITHFQEYPFSPYPCFNSIIETAPGAYQIVGLEGKIPMVYSLMATLGH